MDTRPDVIRRGTPAFRRANIALFLSAFSVFASLYSVQPILPLLASEFGLDAAGSSVALSATTMVLAVALVLCSWLGNRIDRKRLMISAMIASAALGLVVPLMDQWWALVTLRALMGLTLAGVPAIAMVYLAEEMAPEALGASMGLYIGGTALGGMSGRLIAGIIADHAGWRVALVALGLVVLVNALAFLWLLPAPRNSARGTMSPRAFARTVAGLFRDKALPLLFLASFLLMGGFVTLYNYVGFRLLEPPYNLSQTQISFIFAVYLVGTVGSAWMGALSGRLGRRKVFLPMIVVMLVGVALTLVSNVWVITLGMAVTTFGFFAAHSIASAWVTRRAMEGRTQAAALYLLAYYVGSSVIGTLGGYGWSGWGWAGVAAISGGTVLMTLAIAVRLYVLPPLMAPDVPGKPPAAV